MIILNLLFASTIILSTSFTRLGIVYNYINSKVLVIQIGCLIMIALGFVLLSPTKTWKIITNSRIAQAIVAFGIISLIATVTGLDPALSFYGHFERGTGLFFLLVTIVGVFFGILFAYQENAVRMRVLYPIALAGGILGFFTWIGVTGLHFSWWNVLGSSSGGGATMGNSSFAGTILMMSFFITLYLLTTEQGQIKKILLGVIGIVTLINPVLISIPIFNPLSGTVAGFIGDARGATVAVMVGLMVSLGIWNLFSKIKLVRIGSYILLGCVGMFLVVGIASLVTPGTTTRNYFIKTTGEARFIYWTMAMKQWTEYPILGTGPETFRYAHEKYFEPKLLMMGEAWADKPHSVYVEILLTTGVLGFFTYGMIFFFLIRSLIRAGKHQSNQAFVASLAGLLTAYAINNLIIFDTITSLFLFVIIVFWVASETEWRDESVVNKSTCLQIQACKCVTALIITLPVGWIIYGQYQKLAITWNELFAQPPERTILYQKSEQVSGYGAGISFAQRADDYGQQYQRDQMVSVEVALEDIQAINETLITVMQKNPANMQSYIALGNLALGYLKQGETVITPREKIVWLNQLAFAAQGLKSRYPHHPKAQYFFERLHSAQNQ